jgi:hypothetical protein
VAEYPDSPEQLRQGDVFVAEQDISHLEVEVIGLRFSRGDAGVYVTVRSGRVLFYGFSERIRIVKRA